MNRSRSHHVLPGLFQSARSFPSSNSPPKSGISSMRSVSRIPEVSPFVPPPSITAVPFRGISTRTIGVEKNHPNRMTELALSRRRNQPSVPSSLLYWPSTNRSTRRLATFCTRMSSSWRILWLCTRSWSISVLKPRNFLPMSHSVPGSMDEACKKGTTTLHSQCWHPQRTSRS
jgi:hypothetical protein